MQALLITANNAEFIDIEPTLENIAKLLKTDVFNTSSTKRYIKNGALALRIYHLDLADESIDYFTTGFLVNESSFKPDIPGTSIVFVIDDLYNTGEEEFINFGEVGKMFLTNELKTYIRNKEEHPVLIVDCGI